jgi:riboflavin synthase
MFTGIIEELGRVAGVERRGEVIRLRLGAERVFEDAHLGDSISVNGACLTVTDLARDQAAFDVMQETIHRTNLNLLRVGDRVNLERALRLDRRLGGHLVQGHVDGLGVIRERATRGPTVFWEVAAPPEVLRYVVPKGSMAVDGVSLTVIERRPESFTFATIPHTLAQTTLGLRREGEMVNLETDLLGKYVEAFLQRSEEAPRELTWDFLAEQGFV